MFTSVTDSLPRTEQESAWPGLATTLDEQNVKTADDSLPSDPVPHYLLDRNEPSATKALASSIKQRRNEKAALFNITLPKVRGIFEDEMFKVVTTGKKTHQKSWKRIVTKPIFVGEGFTRQNPKAERFIRFVDTSSTEGYRKADLAFIL
ncbi:Ribosome biogenesis protein [Colletotrichum noveboracense]|nr:Ribosome biogenesis protein [Colletotrichum noveboracense]KAJ0278966.1 hypothetical protein CBS470a_009520 [Colletotrichum nupharicola]